MNQKLISHIDLCCTGNPDAFGYIVAEYQQLVYTLSFRLLRDADDAKDATQETFIKAWQNISRYKHDYKFSTWIYKIASKLINNWIMKTIKIITTAFVAVFMVSCGTYYRIVTTLDRDGKARREVYAKSDSAFMAADASANPFLFNIGADWNVTRFDSATRYDFFGTEKDINVKASKSASSIDQFSKELTCDPAKRSFAAPDETLTKKFRWFYTNYTFTGVYKKLDYNAPVPIEKYLTKDEQKLWTQGGSTDYGTMNGMEINNLLGGIEDQFMKWYSRNCFEISLNCIGKFTNEIAPDTDKDKLYKELNEQEKWEDMTPERVCKALDGYYKTNRYTEIYQANEKTIRKEFDDSTAMVNLLGNTISYELVVPGEIISTNSPIVNSGNLTWKVDGIRILFDDYTLTAEYRVVNLWAFIISGLILIIAITSIILLLKRKRLA